MTHEALPRVCTPAEFLAASPRERRRFVRAQIDLTPETWNQRDWFHPDEDSLRRERDKPESERNVCGTAFCFAGWAGVLAGYRFVGRTSAVWDPERGCSYSVAVVAEKLLGLLEVDAGDDLFSGGNSLERIDQILDDMDVAEDELAAETANK